MSLPMQIVVAQVVLGFACSFAFFAYELEVGRSAALAAACAILPNLNYAWMQGRTLNAMKLLVHGVLRMMLTLVLMTVCIVVFTIEPIGFFVTFAVVQLGYFAPSLGRNR